MRSDNIIKELCLSIAVLGATIGVAYAADPSPPCLPAYLGSKANLTFQGTWRYDSTGIITDRFVDLGDTKPVPTVYGVDLSNHNTNIDYRRLSQCGAKFAFLRIDDAFNQHAAGLSAAGIGFMPTWDMQRTAPYKGTAAPFANISLYLPYRGMATDPTKIDQLDKSQLVQDARAYGIFLADRFLENVAAKGDPAISTYSLGANGKKVFAIDVEERNNHAISAGVAPEYGVVYNATLVAAAREIQRRNSSLIPVIYTYPEVYSKFLRYAAPRDELALQSYPAWLSRLRPHGADTYVMGSLDPREVDLQRFCRGSAGDRCIFQQYSFRGVVAYGVAIPVTDKAKQISHDIDRLFMITECKLTSGQAIVRADTFKSRCAP